MNDSTPKSTGFCFDLDGTVLSTPVLSMVAAAADLVEEIDVLSAATDAGQLPFVRSMRLRCRILDSIPVSEARRRASVATVDPDVGSVLASKRPRVRLVTGLPDCWLTELSEQLGCTIAASTADVDGDRFIGLTEVADKAAVVNSMRAEFDQIVAIGSGADDLAMLEAADVAVAYGLSAPHPLRELADYWVTNGRALWELLRPL